MPFEIQQYIPWYIPRCTNGTQQIAGLMLVLGIRLRTAADSLIIGMHMCTGLVMFPVVDLMVYASKKLIHAKKWPTHEGVPFSITSGYISEK